METVFDNYVGKFVRIQIKHKRYRGVLLRIQDDWVTLRVSGSEQSFRMQTIRRIVQCEPSAFADIFSFGRNVFKRIFRFFCHKASTENANKDQSADEIDVGSENQIDSQEELVSKLRESDTIDPDINSSILLSKTIQDNEEYKANIKIINTSKWCCYYDGVALSSQKLPKHLSVPKKRQEFFSKTGWYLCSFYVLKGKVPPILVLSQASYVTRQLVDAFIAGTFGRVFKASQKEASSQPSSPPLPNAPIDTVAAYKAFISTFETCCSFDVEYPLAHLTVTLNNAGFNHKAFGFLRMLQCIQSFHSQRVELSMDVNGHPVVIVKSPESAPIPPESVAKAWAAFQKAFAERCQYNQKYPLTVLTSLLSGSGFDYKNFGCVKMLQCIQLFPRESISITFDGHGDPIVAVTNSSIVKEDDSKLIKREGKITAYFVERKHGFLVETPTGQTWFFHDAHIHNEKLLSELHNNILGQEITFEGKDFVLPGKTYPSVKTILELNNPTEDMEDEVSLSENNNQYEIPVSRRGNHSVFSLYKIRTCPFDGVDARVLQSRKFSDKDISGVKFRLDQLYKSRGYIPAELCKYHLSLAALNFALGKDDCSVARERQLHYSLLAEAGILDLSTSPEVVRFYAIEALRESALCFSTGDNSRMQLHQAKALYLLVLSYYTHPIFKRAHLEEYAKDFPALVQGLKDDSALLLMINDLPFYKAKIPPRAFNLLFDEILKLNPSVADTLVQYQCAWDLILPLFENVQSLSKSTFTQQKDALATVADNLLGADLTNFRAFLSVFYLVGDYLDKRLFADREIAFLVATKKLGQVIEKFYKQPTSMAVEALAPSLLSLQKLLEKDFDLWKSQSPELEVENVLEADGYSLSPENTLELKLLISNTNDSAPPIESITLSLQGRESRESYSPEVLGGQQKHVEMSLGFTPTEQEILDKAFSVDVLVSYRTRSGEKQAGPFPISVRLEQMILEPIANPYLAYAGGNPIDEDDAMMFYGRDQLVGEIRDLLSDGYSGQCFVLYGQKRSGKTSIMKQIKRALPPECFYTQISAQEFNYDTQKLLSTFAKNVLDTVLENADDEGIQLANMPSFEFANSDPILSVKQISRSLRQVGRNWILAIDEFTCIYSNNSEQTESFMHAWKALLQGHVFNALVIGQDTMPLFKQAYPNDFCVSHDRRISFLSEEDSAALASEPIEYDGDSRYRGNSLTKIYQKTAGSPYFLQKFCSEIVKFLNARKAAIVTEADINTIADNLVHGRGDAPLRKEDFDALATAGDVKLSPVPEHVIWDVLTRIAIHSSGSSWCDIEDLNIDENYKVALEDLRNRDTVQVENGMVRIRVELFADWLRVNNRGVLS